MSALDEDLVKVVDVYGEIQYERLFVTRIICILEDGRSFFLERVPFDIVLALKRMHGEEIPDDRERLVDILLSMPQVLEVIGRNLRRVIINELDEESGVYSAIAEFTDGEVMIQRKMVPSHAIFIAALTKKPIYIAKRLVDQQEEIIGSASLGEFGEDQDKDELGDIEDDFLDLDLGEMGEGHEMFPDEDSDNPDFDEDNSLDNI